MYTMFLEFLAFQKLKYTHLYVPNSKVDFGICSVCYYLYKLRAVVVVITHGEVYSVPYYMIKFVSSWWFSPGTPEGRDGFLHQ